MSFSQDVKDELNSIYPKARHCQLAANEARVIFGGGVDMRGDGLKIQSDCCRRTYIRTAFIERGTVNDPAKGYHLEINCPGEDSGRQLIEFLAKDNITGHMIERAGRCSVYIKEAEQISDTLALMGAQKAVLSMENERIIHEVRGDINRRVNCETANIRKTSQAAVKQMEAIRYLAECGELSHLPMTLRQMADVRMEYPDESLAELGKMMEPPVGKSGVNHRLRKLIELAEKRGMRNE